MADKNAAAALDSNSPTTGYEPSSHNHEEGSLTLAPMPWGAGRVQEEKHGREGFVALPLDGAKKGTEIYSFFFGGKTERTTTGFWVKLYGPPIRFGVLSQLCSPPTSA